ncbi:uncharacterized protein LOC143681536 [Tamandua tetradactyla]|uniref:uncharacterized protein LOC143681536 n=1 Tax=Tamandua tetradactyla TaxID=48850 RepID=UPI0040546C60
MGCTDGLLVLWLLFGVPEGIPVGGQEGEERTSHRLVIGSVISLETTPLEKICKLSQEEFFSCGVPRLWRECRSYLAYEETPTGPGYFGNCWGLQSHGCSYIAFWNHMHLD